MRPSHPLKSPTTLTRRALGAHTAKCTPGRTPCDHRPGPEAIERSDVRALGKEVLIERGQHRTVAVGIVDLDRLAAAALDGQPVVESIAGLTRQEGDEQPARIDRREPEIAAVAAVAEGHRRSVWPEDADRQTRLAVVREVVRSEDREGIRVKPAAEEVDGGGSQRSGHQLIVLGP